MPKPHLTPFRVCRCGEQYRPPLYADTPEDYRMCDPCRAKAMRRRDREGAPYTNPYPSAILGEGTVIRFGCYIMIPREYRFPMAHLLDENPQKFLESLIGGVVSNICEGPCTAAMTPEVREEWEKIKPKVIIRYVPNKHVDRSSNTG